MKLLFSFAVLFAALGAQAVEYPIKNFLQIPYALESATGISHKTPDIMSYYNNQKSKFPQKGDMIEITVSGGLAQLSYGSYFCEKLIVSDSKLPPAQRWLHSEVDFTKEPFEWSDAVLASVFRDYSEVFWLRSIETDEMNILNEEVKTLRATFPNEVASIKPFLTTVCSVFAGSFAFLLL